MPYVLFSPVPWCLALLLALCLGWRRLRGGWRITGVVACALLLLCCAPLGANLLERLLESRVPAAAYCPPDGGGAIVLLSGGFQRVPRAVDDYRALNPESWNRTRAATELWHRRGRDRLWIAGGGWLRIRESVVLGRLARDWGVPPDALRIESQSATTRESAQALAPALRGQRVRLVTSPWHRARAWQAFAAAGLDACVLDTGTDVVPFENLGYLLPQGSAIAKSENALYELVGIAWYRLLDRRRGRS